MLKEIILAEDTDTPITIGIYGPWGIGKTCLMRMLRDQIVSKELLSLRTLWFNAWKFHQEDALWRALSLRVIDSLHLRYEDGQPRGGLGSPHRYSVPVHFSIQRRRRYRVALNWHARDLQAEVIAQDRKKYHYFCCYSCLTGPITAIGFPALSTTKLSLR